MEETMGEKIKEGFNNVKEKLNEIKDEAVDVLETPGENLNEQLSDHDHNEYDESCGCSCCIEYEDENDVVEEYEETDIIMSDNKDLLADAMDRDTEMV